MYNLCNLMVYCEKSANIQNRIYKTLSEYEITFKQFNSLRLMFSSVKNYNNYAIFVVSSIELLNKIKLASKQWYNYQNRVLVIYCHKEVVDSYFNNWSLFPDLSPLKNFIHKNLLSKNIKPQEHSLTLLNKLVKLELENLNISDKYTGFDYLIEILSNAMRHNFYCDDYIKLFECVASSHLASLDTIERAVRHMLISNWKENITFKTALNLNKNIIEKPNSKNILNAILDYLKKVI